MFIIILGIVRKINSSAICNHLFMHILQFNLATFSFPILGNFPAALLTFQEFMVCFS